MGCPKTRACQALYIYIYIVILSGNEIYNVPILTVPTLTHWGRVTHICVSNLTPDRRQVIIWTNARILLIGPLGTNCSEILIEILNVSFKKMRVKVSSAKWRPFCLGLNVLKRLRITVVDFSVTVTVCTFASGVWMFCTVNANSKLAPGNPTLWHGVPVAPIQKSFGSNERDWKPGKNYRFLVNFAPTESLDILRLATVRFTSIRSWQI